MIYYVTDNYGESVVSRNKCQSVSLWRGKRKLGSFANSCDHFINYMLNSRLEEYATCNIIDSDGLN